MITLGLYVIATTSTAFTHSFETFALARFFTGAGIGGEYSAINSAIDELIPARVRGWTDLAINGSYWIGTAIGAAASVLLLNPKYFAIDVGWRVGFGIGAFLAVGVLLLRQFLPESPRWLMTHGRADEAEEIVADIEEHVERHTDEPLPEPKGTIEVKQTDHIGFGPVIGAVFGEHWRRSVLGFSLMMSQAFLYNAIFFTYALVLTNFYNVSSDAVGWYLLPFAAGNFLGPVLLGRLFDTVGRRIMISSTYIIAGVGLDRGRIPVPARRDLGHRAHDRLVDHLLLRLGRRELRLPHGQRGLPDGDAGHGDRVLLRGGHRRRWHHRPRAVWPQHRHRQPHDRVLRLPARCRADDPRRSQRDLAGRERRAATPRGRRHTAHRRLVTVPTLPLPTNRLQTLCGVSRCLARGVESPRASSASARASWTPTLRRRISWPPS